MIPWWWYLDISHQKEKRNNKSTSTWRVFFIWEVCQIEWHFYRRISTQNLLFYKSDFLNDASPRAHLRDCRSSHRRCSLKKAVLKDFAIFTGKHLCWSLFFKKVTTLQPCNFIKKRLQHRRFPVNIAKFLRTIILKNICERLLHILKCSQIILKYF